MRAGDAGGAEITRLPGNVHPALLEASAEYRSHQSMRDCGPVHRRRVYKELPETDDEAELFRREEAQRQVAFFCERAEESRAAIQARLSDDPEYGGHHWPGGDIGSHHVAAFSETGLRSVGNPILEIFVAWAPKTDKKRKPKEILWIDPDERRELNRAERRWLHSAQRKERLDKQSSKMFGLDNVYVEFGRKFLRGWKQDMDASWPNEHALRDDLQQKVDRGDIPCLPHVVTWIDDGTDQVVRPHLWWLLPPGSEVWNDPSDPRCRMDIVNKYRAVVRGCAKALIDLGCDVSATSLPTKGKSPLAPATRNAFFNWSCFPNLTEWSESVDTTMRSTDIARAKAAHDSGDTVEGSCAAFNTMRKAAIADLREMHLADDADYLAALADRQVLASLMEDRLQGTIASMTTDDAERRKLFGMSRGIIRYIADGWDPSRCKARDKDLGVCKDAVAGLKTLAARQAVGGVYGAERNAAHHRAIVVAVRDRMIANGVMPTKSAVARETGFHRDTVANHWTATVVEKEVETTIPEVRLEAPKTVSVLWSDDGDNSTDHVKNILHTITVSTIHVPDVPNDGVTVQHGGTTMNTIRRQHLTNPTMKVGVLKDSQPALVVGAVADDPERQECLGMNAVEVSNSNLRSYCETKAATAVQRIRRLGRMVVDGGAQQVVPVVSVVQDVQRVNPASIVVPAAAGRLRRLGRPVTAVSFPPAVSSPVPSVDYVKGKETTPCMVDTVMVKDVLPVVEDSILPTIRRRLGKPVTVAPSSSVVSKPIKTIEPVVASSESARMMSREEFDEWHAERVRIRACKPYVAPSLDSLKMTDDDIAKAMAFIRSMDDWIPASMSPMGRR